MSEGPDSLRTFEENRYTVDKPVLFRHILFFSESWVRDLATWVDVNRREAGLDYLAASHAAGFYLLMRSFGAALSHGSIVNAETVTKSDSKDCEMR